MVHAKMRFYHSLPVYNHISTENTKDENMISDQ